MTTSKSKTIKVKIQLHATKLRNVAGAFKGTSDPFAVVTLLAAGHNEQPIILGQTEVIKNSLDPTWTKTFPLDYSLGKLRHINIGVYDKISKAKNDKPMGSAMFEIGDVLGAKGNIKGKRLSNGGFLYVRVTEMRDDVRASIVGINGIGVQDVPSDDAKLKLKLRGVNLKNVEGFFKGKSDPFYELSKSIDVPGGGKGWRVHYRSQHIKNNLNPIWEETEMDLIDLYEDGDCDKPVRISVYDHEKSGRHKSMGSFETTVSGLINASVGGDTVDKNKVFYLMNGTKTYGMVAVMNASLSSSSAATAPPPTIPAMTGYAEPEPIKMPPEQPPAYSHPAAIDHVMPLPLPVPILPPPSAAPISTPNQRPTFIDYISGSCDLNMCVAIDFTGSNGDPRRYGTLHYMHRDGQLNDYEKAIVGVGSILAKYDANKNFPVWGFGAKYGGVIQHCFQVGPKAEADGVQGILEAYRSVFRSGLVMSAPTVFEACIAQAASRARQEQEKASQCGKQAYTVLLLLTDGSVSDVGRTKAAIMAASDSPLSIVIVGIGTADFSAMKFLDDFSNDRDIVQFVEFNAHQYNKASLTSETLDEIPDQLVNYFYSRGIMPTSLESDSQLSIAVDDYDETEDIDLSMNFNSEGEIALDGFEGTFVDDSYEGAAAKYDGIKILPPPSNVASYNPSASVPTTSHQQPYNSSASVPPTSHQQPYNSSASVPPTSHHQLYNPSASVPALSQQQPHYTSIPPPSFQGRLATYTPEQNPPPPSAAPSPLKATFQVQVPPNGRPGMQLQVRNPQNGQLMRVTIPQGVAPGGCFGVAA